MSVTQDDETSARLQGSPWEALAPAHTSHAIACECGRCWNVIRTPLPNPISEHMTCLCGATLLSWCEAADYSFEPLNEDV